MAIVYIIAGVFIGISIATFTMVNSMIIKIKIEGMSFKQLNEYIREVIPSFSGWSFPIGTWQFYQSQISKGLRYDNIKDMVIHFVCNPSYANKMLRDFPHFGSIMPCSWAVYETMNGNIYIAKMNIKMMSILFPGTVGKIMKNVAGTEEAMIKKIKEKTRTSNKISDKKEDGYARV